MATTLEALARAAWVRWGNYAKHTPCDGCGEFVYCRAKTSAGPFLCLACHDLKGAPQ
jgi:hypothetical protein